MVRYRTLRGPAYAPYPQARAPGGEVLRTVVEYEALPTSTGCTTAGLSALVEDHDAVAVVGESPGCDEPSDPGSDHGHLQRPGHGRSRSPLRVSLDIDTAAVGKGGTGANRSKNGNLGRERPVELIQAPEDSSERGGIAAVERVPVVEIDQPLQSSFCTGGPLQEGLAPGHADVVVELPVDEERSLGRVPEWVSGSPPRQGLPTGLGRTWIRAVVVQGLPCPFGQRGDPVVIPMPRAVDIGELAPDEKLVEEFLRARTAVLECISSEAKRRDVPGVQVG